MSEERKEQVSALVDGELHRREAENLLDAIDADTNLRDQWGRYHLIAEAIKHNLPTANSMDIAQRVRQSIEQEPTVLASVSRFANIRKPLAGLAIAASVAAVAIVGIQQPDSGNIPAAIGVQQLSQLSVPKPVTPVVAQRVRWTVIEPVVETRLNSYLVNHNERMSSGMQGLLPYVRIVGYDARQK